MLEVTWQQQGAEAAWRLYSQLLLLPAAGGDMFRGMLQLLKRGGAEGKEEEGGKLSKGALKRLRAVFEAAVRAYGKEDAGVWLAYAAFEQQEGKQGAGAVYWRAVKELDAPEEFIALYREQVSAVDVSSGV